MEPAKLLPIVATAGAFLVIVAAAYALRTFLNPERTARDRIADLTQAGKETGPLLTSRQETGGMTWKVGALARPQDKDAAEELRRRLSQAGFRSRNNLEAFSAVRAALAIALPVLAVIIAMNLAPKLELVYHALLVMFGIAAGYYMPNLLITSRIKTRQEELMRSFPDALDLLVSSVEAGLGLDAAFRRVAQEMEGPGPMLARELQLVNHEVAAGVPRTEALRHLDHRTGLEEVNSLVNVLMQAERFGTSVARALRIHSELVRKKRMLAAEERAAGLSPKLTVAMILFIFPPLVIVLVGPAVISVLRNLMPTLGGH